MELTQTNKGSLKEGVKKDGTKYSVRDNRDRFFYPSEWMKFYDGLRSNQKIVFDVLIGTGARINEALHIKGEDCDFVRNSIILRVTKTKATKGEKNPRPRTISIPSQLSRKIKTFVNLNGLKNDDYIMGRKVNGKVWQRYSATGAFLALKRGLQRAGIKDWYMFSLHNIRKTHGNYLKALGIDGAEICTRLGHDYNTFLKAYSSPDIFNFKDKSEMRLILGDLYLR